MWFFLNNDFLSLCGRLSFLIYNWNPQSVFTISLDLFCQSSFSWIRRMRGDGPIIILKFEFIFFVSVFWPQNLFPAFLEISSWNDSQVYFSRAKRLASNVVKNRVITQSNLWKIRFRFLSGNKDANRCRPENNKKNLVFLLLLRTTFFQPATSIDAVKFRENTVLFFQKKKNKIPEPLKTSFLRTIERPFSISFFHSLEWPKVKVVWP